MKLIKILANACTSDEYKEFNDHLFGKINQLENDMNSNEIELRLLGIAWYVCYYSDPDEAYIEDVTVGEGADMSDYLTEEFKDMLHEALLVKLERIACEDRAEMAHNEYSWRKQNEKMGD